MTAELFAGNSTLRQPKQPVQGDHVLFEDEDFYRIANYDRMRPFFISIVSDADHWLFLSSTGALTAGRQNAENALFPYYTDDKIHDSAEITGSKTVLVAARDGQDRLWTPFSNRYAGVYNIHRNLYKSIWGNKIIFEEINEDLSLTFRYGWYNSERFGFVRRAWLRNTGPTPCEIHLADGLLNILPSNAGVQFQLEKSTLLDAYKRSELDPETRLAFFTLSSIPIDRPEPAESLRASTAWLIGLEKAIVRLSAADGLLEPDQPATTEVRGERGAYILNSRFELAPDATIEWVLVADVNQTHAAISRTRQLLRNPARLRKAVLADIARGTRELRRIVGTSDGLQKTSSALRDARHYSNVLFNIMRGGVFNSGSLVDTRDLMRFVAAANRKVAAKHRRWLAALPSSIPCSRLVKLAAERKDPQLERICREYLPLTFSRRHGDPSRPWNRFSISSRDRDGKRILDYEGNWRDIFQNWEALAWSFPAFTAGMICRFVNASTADGYNPYRITRDGLDWEVVDPHDPWSFIGYWGDHQVIYLLKLLEILRQHEPATLRSLLQRRIFSYANVPYRIKGYANLLSDPRNTVEFDSATDRLAKIRAKEIGADGKLLQDRAGEVLLVNLTEKLLVSILAKLSNFIPGAGIWLNTQRPEWNDANNALVGNGTSMVTLCYLRRHFAFLLEVYRSLGSERIALSKEVAECFDKTFDALERHGKSLGITADPHTPSAITDADRKRVLDDLGRAGSAYRESIYKGLSGKQREISAKRLIEFFELGLRWMDHSIRANRRSDGLYEAYNLVRFEQKRIGIRRLYPMLEGQVAVLSSGLLTPQESLDVLRALRASSLYRADQHSYVLYPDRPLRPFLEKNQIAAKDIQRSSLLKALLADGNTDLVEAGGDGAAHFNGLIRNAGDARARLDKLAAGKYARLVSRDRTLVTEIFEQLFDHESFTGRSGTFFAYEGLGSIYWHMVSKLLLAAQEAWTRALKEGASAETVEGLARAYDDIRLGIGDAKTPENYGAFPADPYSHTPKHKGASQPGLTGQVKEDILCRWGELGLSVENGRLRFEPRLLQREEFLKQVSKFDCFDPDGAERTLRLKADALAFTLCQTPIVYRVAKNSSVKVHFTDGTTSEHSSFELSERASRELFHRTGTILRIEVALNASDFR